MACAKKSTDQEQRENGFVTNPADYVNPFVGTAPLTDPEFIGYTPPKDWRVWAGLTFPGSSLPNAMVQLSPITQYGSGAGYEYEDDEIIGFAHTNKGHWNLCNLPILPVSNGATYPFKSKFKKDTEGASPAYYEVNLNDYGVKVRLTSTLRAGIHEYTFSNPEDRNILFDLGRSNNRVNSWEIEQEADSIISGYQQVGGDRISFYAVLNTAIDSLEENHEEKGGYALAQLVSGKAPVTLKVGLSFVSVENAKNNLHKEVGDKNFDTIHQQGRKEWNKLLSSVQVSGGSEKEKQMFYSSLYRSFLWPALRSDANGDFMDDAGTKQNRDFQYYTLPSLWDTYRNKLVLLGMLRPEMTSDVIASMINKGEIRGFMPTFFHGDHAASFIASSYLRGIKDYDINKAYDLLINNAYKEGGTRPHIAEYIEKGYIPEPDIENPNTETVASAGVSKTLEYAVDDYSLAKLAKALGDEEKYEDLMQRSKNYKNVFDPKTNFMRGRLDDGSWVTPFDPQYPYYEYMYREANAWQVSFFVPHDMPGLVNLYESNQRFEEKVDSLFTLPWNPEHIARNVSSFIGQYCQGNQPDHEAPYAYYFINKPEKSQKILDKIIKDFYGVGKWGIALPGMDDAGEMSAWYVFAASGIYPLSPVDNDFIVSVPVFDTVRWNLPSGNSFEIRQDGTSRKLSGVEWDDSPIEGYFVSYDQLNAGGTLTVQTKE